MEATKEVFSPLAGPRFCGAVGAKPSYYRARYYDPAAGRFLSEDPLGFAADGVNFYEYAYDNPTDWIDPLGLQGLTPSGPTPSPMPPPAPPVEPPPVPVEPILPVAGGGAAAAGGGSALAVGGLITVDVGLAIYDGIQFYHLGQAFGWWGPSPQLSPQPAPQPGQNCKKDQDKCDEQYAAERAYCSKNFWGTPLYGACRDRAFWRWNNCKRGLPSPGPLDPRKW